MRIFARLGLVVCLFGSVSGGQSAWAEKVVLQGVAPELEVVAELDERPSNIAVTISGEIIVSMNPYDKPKNKIVLIKKDGAVEPFPSAEWNDKEGPDAHAIGFTHVTGIRSTTRGTILVLDMGNEKHAPRFVEFDVLRRQVMTTRYIPRDFTTEQSYLQDFALNWDINHAYVSDMGQLDPTQPAKPGLIDVDLNGGWMFRLMDGMPAIQPPEKPIMIGGKDLSVTKDGKDYPVRGALGPITLDVLRDTMYFGPMGEGKLYKVPLSKMSDVTVDADTLAKRIEVVGDKPASAGITVDAEENVYITAIEKNEIGVIDKAGQYRSYIKDDRLQWANGLAYAPNGYIYVTISRLNELPMYNGGKEPAEKKPYLIARFKPIAPAAVGR
ncbi:MAG: L-dopachrome tautomerase-related protein [Pseudobdellovibrionaceae bacterium]|jgi:hypothetical protein|nr:L-dopachrome tautomerase-related protein [Pseudobdellovibrionaceae bacterium]